jgi:PAS domain S-box-containing protein
MDESITLSALVLDTTERKRAEERLRRSETYLAEAQRLSHTGSWALKVSSGELFWSEEHFRIVGLDPMTKEAPAYPLCLKIIHADDRADVVEALERAIREKTEFETECRIVRPDGTIGFIRSVAQPVFSKPGAVVEYVGTIIDKTEQMRAEETLRRSEAALQEARAELAQVTRMTAMAEIAASIAHEINQPLGAIVNNANYCLPLIGISSTEAKTREALADMVSDAHRASAIITRIRELTRPAATEITWLDVREVTGKVLVLVRHLLNEHRVVVKTRFAKGLPRIRADRVQLQQILFNLIINAIEAMVQVEERARVLTIQVRRDTLDQESAVLITVADTGVGLDSQAGAHLFEAFYTTKPKGMGMGLRISHSIVEGYGGRLFAKPNRGAGTTFSCVLPVRGGEER